MKKEQTDISKADDDASNEVVIDGKEFDKSYRNELVESQDQDKKTTESSSSQNFYKLVKQFAIDGAILSSDNQMPIEDRANKRNRLSHLRKQQNIEQVIQKTSAYCANHDIKSRTDHDWLSRYISLAEDINNQTMQDLWAKILAGELTKPGSFSYKSLKVFRDMSIIDAKLLSKACSLALKDTSKKNIRLISGVYQQPSLFNFFSKTRQLPINLSQFGLNYADLLTLAENHLIYIQESESNVMMKSEKLHFIFNGKPLKISALQNKVSLRFYKFTPLGAELANLITDKANDEFFTYLKDQLSEHFEISE